MTMKYIASSFSLQMVPGGGTFDVRAVDAHSVALYCQHIETWREGKEWASSRRPDFVSIVGHEGTAKALSALTGFEVPVNRQAIQLQPDDRLLVAQPTGNRITYGQEIDCPELTFFEVSFHTCPVKSIRAFSDFELCNEVAQRDIDVGAVLADCE